MWLIALCLVSWYLLTLLCGGPLVAFVLHISTATFIAVFLPFGLHSWRASRFAHFVGRTLMRVSIDAKSVHRLQQLDERKTYWFPCDPHGQAPLHMTYVFAAHGNVGMPEGVARKTVVMGHWLILLLPFACQLCQLFGVTFSAPFTVQRSRAFNANIALCPGGLPAKNTCMLRRHDSNHVYSTKPPVYVVARRRPGYLRLAAKEKALIVPILSPDEERAFVNFNPLSWTGIPYVVLMFGKEWLFRPFCNVTVRVGEPIDAARFDPTKESDMLALNNLYYERIKQLASPDYCVVLE